MGGLARAVGIAFVGVVCACNAITGADGLSSDEASDQAPLPTRHRGEQTSSSSSGETLASSSSTSSSGGTSSSGDPIPADDGGNAPPDAGTDAPPPNTGGGTFLDAFTRADSANVGNGWLEKTNAFSILNGAAKQTGAGSYKNFLVARPAGEAALDVEISVDVKHSAVDGDPCLYGRMQPASNTAGTLVSYTFYAYNDFAFLDRDGAAQGDFAELASQAISPAFTAPYAYSLSLKITGTNPVHIIAQVKDANGNVKVNFDVNDASAGRITTAGSVAFGSGGADGALFDNFKRTTF